jgi:hypothetical protein
MDQLPALSNLDLSNQVSVTVARKALDAEQEQGVAVVQMLKAAADVQSSDRAASNQHGLDLYA